MGVGTRANYREGLIFWLCFALSSMVFVFDSEDLEQPSSVVDDGQSSILMVSDAPEH